MMTTQQAIQGVDESGNPVDLSALEETGAAFDPTTQHLDLTKEEKRRTTSLMMAIQAYKELIIREADYLREVANLARDNRGPEIQPATIDAMLVAAIKFDRFIVGGEHNADMVPEGDSQEPEDDGPTEPSD